MADKFLSTPSARRATIKITSLVDAQKFLSTPSARRATFTENRKKLPKYISIHALREEGDDWCFGCVQQSNAISIHALREEGDV